MCSSIESSIHCKVIALSFGTKSLNLILISLKLKTRWTILLGKYPLNVYLNVKRLTFKNIPLDKR